MELSEFDFILPKELIAKQPVKPRDNSRLLVLDKKNGEIEHKKFFNIVDYLNKGDVLVMNNSKVFPARLIGKKEASGGKVEIFLHHFEENKTWQCLIGGRNIQEGLEIIFEEDLKAKVISNNHDGTWKVEFNFGYKGMMNIVENIGEVPLPPYIKREESEGKLNIHDKENYQTVFADNTKTGSVAAPTAGLHFTDELLEELKDKGVIIKYVTLHVGLGTFAPVKTDKIEDHKMHAEWVEVGEDVMNEILIAKNENRRVITVGTTSTRTLEAVFKEGNPSLRHSSGQAVNSGQVLRTWVNIFIYPGYKFKIVDAMITNFHLPKSSLIMLVSALAGKNNIDKAYKEAIAEKYRFYSYGDAMFIK